MIVQGSRYQGVPMTGIRTVDGKDRKLIHDRTVFSMADVGADGIEYEVKGEETLDALADRFYGDDTLWWLIGDVNNIFFAFAVVPGDRIIIPDPSIRARAAK